jgi:hypothetical protein
MDLIRHLLLSLEAGADSEDLKRYDADAQIYHMVLLKDAEMIDAIIRHDERGIPNGVVVLRMTWKGHEFLDSIRDNKLWAKVRTHVLTPAASWTFSIVRDYAKHEIKKQLGLPE